MPASTSREQGRKRDRCGFARRASRPSVPTQWVGPGAAGERARRGELAGLEDRRLCARSAGCPPACKFCRGPAGSAGCSPAICGARARGLGRRERLNDCRYRFRVRPRRPRRVRRAVHARPFRFGPARSLNALISLLYIIPLITKARRSGLGAGVSPSAPPHALPVRRASQPPATPARGRREVRVLIFSPAFDSAPPPASARERGPALSPTPAVGGKGGEGGEGDAAPRWPY